MNTPRHQRATPLDRFLFGAPYYPEHWTEEDRRNDAALMAHAGVTTVRMAEFAWDLVEPARGDFRFSLFDDTIADLAEHGIQTILCTPTATPPRWLTREHPEWMRIDADGRAMCHGSRQHCCTNNPKFRRESKRITRAMARHYRNNPHVIGWQTDNEFFCHFSECYCPSCLVAFQRWLKEKYGDIARLNAAHGTAFWALTYDCFSDVPLPLVDRPTHPNPGLRLDYFRFLSDGITAFQHDQIQELRKTNPKWWISHNGVFGHIDHWKFAENLDFYGVDVYPGFSSTEESRCQTDPVWSALKHERCRSASGNYVVFEQQTGFGGQPHFVLATPKPGQMRLWAWQAAAHGADGVLHFRWRSCRFGAEIYWVGVLDHDNIPRRRYEEFAREGREFARLGKKLLGTVPLVKAAVLLQTDQDEAQLTMPMGLPAPSEQRSHLWRELMHLHLPAGLVDASDSYDGLDLIFLPGFVLMDEVLAARLHAFVENGGVLVASARTATRDRFNRVLSVTPPGWLQETFGVHVEEFGAHDVPSFRLGEKNIPASSVYEVLSVVKGAPANVLASWQELPGKSPHAAPGHPALVLNALGKGKAIYFGSYFAASNSAALVARAVKEAKLKPMAQAAPEVEITCRHSRNSRLYFFLNHSDRKQTVRALSPGIDLIAEKPVQNRLTLPPFGVAVLER